MTGIDEGRAFRGWLLAYPRAYRRERGEEIVGTLLESGVRPSARLAADLVRAGLRARLGRPESRVVVATSLLAALISGLFIASVALRLAWETSRPMPDRAEATAALAEALPGSASADEVRVPPARFVVYGQPATWGSLDTLLFFDGGEYEQASTQLAWHPGNPAPQRQVLAEAEQRLRAAGWDVSALRAHDAVECAGPPCDPANLPEALTLVARRGDTVLTLDMAENSGDPSTVAAALTRVTPPAALPAGLAAGLVGAALAWLVFGWASRRTTRRGPARSLCTGLFVTAMVLWWGPVVLAVPQLLEHQLSQPHPSWHPLWEWLGQPTLSLFFVAGAGCTLLALAVAALPARGGVVRPLVDRPS